MAASYLTSLEVCAGAGGQAIGLEKAGFRHLGLVELDRHACSTLLANRPNWKVHQEDLNQFDGRPYKGVDILAGGLPCPPFSLAGKQLGEDDERNLFPAAIRLVDEVRPKAVMIENVRGILDGVFLDYRTYIEGQIGRMGYKTEWRLLNASDFGVPQLRPRVVFVAVRSDYTEYFAWPAHSFEVAPTVGETLIDLMRARGWKGATAWSKRANDIAPTIVGGSLKHGGPDLGPTRAKKAWAALGVDAHGVVDEAPSVDFVGMPRLTVRMIARLQGFPDSWVITGKKTPAYRQVGNAFPPPVAAAVGSRLKICLSSRRLHAVS